MSVYVALEGADGCGKSTQARRLVSWLEQRGRRVLHLREPGSTPVGESLRQLLLDPAVGDLSPATEALLFFAARAELLDKQIGPALRDGVDVVSDRCFVSSLVYQGLCGDQRALPVGFLSELTVRVHGATVPDRVFVIDVPSELSLQRRAGSSDDRIEGRGAEYHQRVRAGYLEVAAGDPRVDVLDGAADPEAVHRELTARLEPLLEQR